MSEIAFKLKGLGPLVMNNGEKADPDSEFVAAMAEARAANDKKSKEGRDRIARIDWQGGLYMDDKLGPVIPEANLIKCVVQGAAPQKKGKEFDAYLSVSKPFVRLDYPGPRDLDGMWNANMKDRRLVSGNGKPGGPKVIRVRPLFKDWSLSFSMFADEDVSTESLIQAWQYAGKRIGLCERSKFRWGRFEVIESKVISK